MTRIRSEQRLLEERLGFRADEPTKAMIERAAQLERRKLTDSHGEVPEAARKHVPRYPLVSRTLIGR